VREDEPAAQPKAPIEQGPAIVPEKKQKNVLLVDHEDSFVHTLANYLRQTGKLLLLSNAFGTADTSTFPSRRFDRVSGFMP
jgi:hypothetical protein